MKKNRRFAVALLEAAALIVILARAGYGQGREALPPSFPEALLDGDPHFNLALHLQGDIRGNFGPCG